MRGGTSRGPYFRREDLPEDRETLAEVLMAAVGAGHPLNIDGIGGGAAVTTKVAMLSQSTEPGVDIDYFFGQVGVSEREGTLINPRGMNRSAGRSGPKGNSPQAMKLEKVPTVVHSGYLAATALRSGI